MDKATLKQMIEDHQLWLDTKESETPKGEEIDSRWRGPHDTRD